MRKVIAVGLTLGLLIGAQALPADAKKKKKKKKAPAPVVVETTLYFHGEVPVGELEYPTNTVDSVYRNMDPTEPTGQVKSIAMYGANAVAGTSPNPNCAGNQLFPLWVGDLSGKITGDVTVTLNTISAPTSGVVRLWADLRSQACNDSYIAPVAEVEFDVPAGQATFDVVLEGVEAEALGSIMLQIQPTMADPGPSLSRILYDASSAASSISFGCIPTSGSACA